ncbi:MAG: zinc-binding protein [Herpetosiphonaceae bacterium]|nr:MAG: zinc-binding protein [Herpetosiphonaceae bacterium]
MTIVDKMLTCRDCGNQFVFTAGEQEFYAQKGFTNEPARCPACRQARKAASNSRAYGERANNYGGQSSGYGRRDSRGSGDRPRFPAVCAECGRQTTVPFQPTQGRPVYCSDCFQSTRRSSYR